MLKQIWGTQVSGVAVSYAPTKPECPIFASNFFKLTKQ